MRTTATFRAALSYEGFRHLLVAHGLGTLAQVSLTLAVGLEMLHRTGSGAWVSLTVALGFVPYVLFSGLAGVVADRCSRSTVLGVSFWTRAVVGGLLVVGLAAGWPVAWPVGLAAVLGVLATPSYPALLAATRQLVPDRDLPPANALVTGIENAAWIAGPGLLGVLLVVGSGPTAATVVGVVLFVAAGARSSRVRLPGPVRGVGPAGRRGGRAVLAELAEGLRTVGRVRQVRTGMAVAVLDNLLYGYLVVAVVLLVGDGLGGDRALGWLNTGLTAGAVAAMAVANRVAGKRDLGTVLAVLMVGFVAAVVLLAAPAPVGIAVALVTVAGACTLVAEVAAVTVIQRAAPPAVTARVFGVYDQLNVGAIAVGSAIAGPLAMLLGPRGALAVTGLAVGVAAVAVARRLRVVGVDAPRGPRDLLHATDLPGAAGLGNAS
ncbi:MAG TPA: MFS transporter [Jiangellales bacterium]|nr:MFS transporter [Jiangellales bacterium]